jgi:indole-3-glycerol phosphate synthase
MAIQRCETTPIITEVKFASPSSGRIRNADRPTRIANAMLAGGACALSVLSDPDNFGGGVDILAEVAAQVEVPMVMKDIVVSQAQLEAGSRAGADAVVLISEVFSKGLGEAGLDLMADKAHALGLEVIIEANDGEEFDMLRKHGPDLYGINNRNLSTFQLDLGTTEAILAGAGKLDRPVVSESGIESATDVRRLRKAGANAFLVGTSIMRSSDIEGKVRELVKA